MSTANSPQLYIIAGPNGAGKSTVSSYFAEKRAIVYDPDKESKKIIDKFHQLPVESIYYFINNHFQDLIAKATKTNSDFLLESNFRNYQIMEVVDQFKSSGYQTNLMYFLLRSQQESKDRVAERVNDGGHFVDNNSIQLNFNEGLENLCYFASRFDRVLLFNASARLGELTPLLNIDSSKIKYTHGQIPAWAEPTVQKLMTAILKVDRSAENGGITFRHDQR